MASRVSRIIGKFTGLLTLAACSVVGGASVPEPDYTVIISEDPFEVRDYDELVVAKTGMADGSNAAFGRLFDYISGENEGERKVSMTAPVLNTAAEDGTEISMTAPVLQTATPDRDMIFVLPKAFTRDTAPVPSNPNVSLGTIAPRRVAVVRYSGSLDKQAPAQQARLRDWLAAKGLKPAGPAEVAGYDPPWTLPAYRRNEVLIPIEAR